MLGKVVSFGGRFLERLKAISKKRRGCYPGLRRRHRRRLVRMFTYFLCNIRVVTCSVMFVQVAK